ncbi:unnamed protein product [Sphagnum balticum]
MRQIARLSGAIVSQLRSGIALSDLGQVVGELVCNSLDASATQVHVWLDDGASSIRVEDDGCGISRDDLKLVGERHATSKLHTLAELEAGVQTLGFRGEALSSLSHISLMEITSRVRGSPHTYSKIMKGPVTMSFGLSSKQRSRGTTVVVRDIFYNQPVRRRLLSNRQKKAMQSLKEHVLHLALAYPHVTFTVTDAMRQEELLHIQQQPSLLGTLQNIFGDDVCSGLKEIDFAQGKLRLSGFLSNSARQLSSKVRMTLHINHRFVCKTPLHKVMNSWGRTGVSSVKGGLHGQESGKKTRSGRASGRQAYPAFVLNLRCQFSEYDITFEVSKTIVEFKDWSKVLSFLNDVLEASWEQGLTAKQSSLNSEVATVKSECKQKTWQQAEPTGKKAICKRETLSPCEDLPNMFEPQSGRRSPSKVATSRLGFGGTVAPVLPMVTNDNSHKRLSDDLPLQACKRHCSEDFWRQCGHNKDVASLAHQPAGELDLLDEGGFQHIPDCDHIRGGTCTYVDMKLRSQFCSPQVLQNTKRSSLDVLESEGDLDGSPQSSGMQPYLLLPSSPTTSDLSWGCDFPQPCQEIDQLETDIALRPTQHVGVGSERLKPLQQSLLSETDERTCVHETPGLLGERQIWDVFPVEDDIGDRSTTKNDWDGLNTRLLSLEQQSSGTLGSPFKDRLHRHQTVHKTSLAAQEQIEVINLLTDSSDADEGSFHSADDLLMIREGHGGSQGWSSPVHEERHFDELERRNLLQSPSAGSSYETPPFHGTILHGRNSRCTSPSSQCQQRQQRHTLSGPPFYNARRRLSLHDNYAHKFPLPAVDCLQHEATSALVLQPNEAVLSSAEDGEDQQVMILNEYRHLEENHLNADGTQPSKKTCTTLLPWTPEDLQSKWRSLNETPSACAGEKGLSKETVAGMYKVWLNPCMRASGDDVLDISAGVLGATSSSLSPELVTKESLQHLTVLGQVDSKFIAVVASGVLLLVDQHAADERVRLEEFRAHVLAADKKKASTVLAHKLEMTLSLAEQQMLHTYREQIEEWGWHFEAASEAEALDKHRKGARNAACKFQVDAVPCILGVDLTAADLEEFIHQLADTHGASAPPPAVVRVLNYKSCRGAIMFGDALLPAECRQLIHQLKQTSLCFQCAHGRPTMVPLVNLCALHHHFEPTSSTVGMICANTLTGLERENVGTEVMVSKSAAWHGLEDCLPSLARARMRLQQTINT